MNLLSPLLERTIDAVDHKAFGIFKGDLANNLVIISDHARNDVPAQYNDLGLPKDEFKRHIAYDIGAQELTRKLSQRLNAPAIYSKFSRLLIDPNRGTIDPTLIMKISDGSIVPGNVEIDANERQHRIKTYYQPYHDAIDRVIETAIAGGYEPFILSIHSFTPTWKGVPRPWHAGVLWKHDDRFPVPLINALSKQPELVIGENEPYAGGIPGDSIDAHAYARNLPAALIEIRQDLIGDETGVDEWVDRLAKILPQITNNNLKKTTG